MFDMITDFKGTASGTIVSCSFLAGDTSNGEQYLQATTGMIPVGITPNYSKLPPGFPGAGTTYVEAGDNVFGYIMGMTTELICGTAWTAYQLLAPDGSGYGRPANPGDYVGAMAFTTAAAGDIARVVPLQPGTRLVGDRLLAVTANTSLVGFPSGTTFEANAADLQFTLPTAASVPGARFTIVSYAATSTLTAGSVGTQIVPGNGTDKIIESTITPAVNKSLINTAGTAKQGDSITLYSDGSANWLVVAKTGTWARQT